MAEVLPPAILELIVDTAQWIAGLEEAIAALEEFDAALDQTTANLGVFSEAMGAAMAEAAGATEEAAASIVAATDEAAAAYERLGEVADTSAASMDAAAAASSAAGEASAGSAAEVGGASVALGAVVEKAGMAIGTVAIASATMAADFQASVTRLVTSAGESQQATGMVSDGLTNMATQVGFTANELAKAMYPIESAGYHAADGLKVMQAAAEGAKDEGADLTHVADAVTTVMQDYNLKAGDAANITSEMVKAISFGKTNFDSFSKSLATVLPVASAVGLSFADVASVEASMTAHGTTAQRAAMDVAAAIKSLIAPTTQMTKEFKALGITSDEVQQHLSTQGLAGTLEWLRQTAEKGATAIGQTVPEAMKKLIGTSPGLQAALETTNGKADTLTDSIKAVGAATADAQGNVIGFSEVQGNLSFVFSQFKAQLENTAIAIGNVMMPSVENLLKMLDNMFRVMNGNNAVGDAFKAIVDAIGESISALAPILPPLISAFTDLVKVGGSLIADVLRVLAPAVAVILKAFDDLLRAIEPLLPTLTELAGDLGKMLGQMFQDLLDDLKPLLPPLTDLAKSILQTLLQVVKDLAPSLEQLVKSVADWLPALVPLIPILTDLVTKGLGPFLDVMAKIAAFLVGGFAGFLKEAGKGFGMITDGVREAEKWFVSLPDAVDNAAARVGKAMAALPQKIGEAIQSIGQDIGNRWNHGMDLLKQDAQFAIDAVTSYFKDFPQKLGYSIGQVVGVVARESANIGKGLVTGVENGVDAVKKFFSVDLPLAIGTAVADAQNWLKTTGVQILNGLLDGIRNTVGSLQQWWYSLPGTIQGWVSDARDWLINAGRDAINGLIDGVEQKLGDIYRAMSAGPGSGVKGTVMSPFDDAANWLTTAGSNIIHGIWSGMVNSFNWLMNNVASFADSIKNGFMSALHINSPSKVMADVVGVGIVEGIAEGMTGNLHLMHNAIGTVKGTLLSGLGGAGVSVGGLGLPSGSAGLAVGGGGNGILVINNNVQGSVVAENEIQRLNQTQTLRYNFRNPTNGLSLFGRGSS